MSRSILPMVALTLTIAASTPVVAQPPQFSCDWPAVAARLVAQLDPAPGESLLLGARPARADGALGGGGSVDIDLSNVTANDVEAAIDMARLANGPQKALLDHVAGAVSHVASVGGDMAGLDQAAPDDDSSA